jgi:FkbM family methyltransferase
MDKMTLEEYERIDPGARVEHDGVQVVFATPNTYTKWRADTLFTKEPDTIAWIGAFQPEDVLVDIGANVGGYSLWAARARHARVFAFEPESQNYALLNRNIHINQLDHRVTAFCVALSDESGFGKLNIGKFLAGGSCHAFGDALNFAEQPMQPSFVQGCVSATLDELVARGVIPVPNHIKIDVDGIEPKIIQGARTTLANPVLRSVLIETNTNLESHRDMVDTMLAAGFGYDAAQVDLAQRKQGAFKGVGNYVFRR